MVNCCIFYYSGYYSGTTVRVFWSPDFKQTTVYKIHMKIIEEVHFVRIKFKLLIEAWRNMWAARYDKNSLFTIHIFNFEK